MKQNFSEALETILREDPRYSREAYGFVREGLDFTCKMLKKEGHGPQRHVTGQELLEGLRHYALQQFGPMSKTVLDYWGVRRCEDFGEIVFNMVEKGILGRTEEDRREDFAGGYDFEEAFVKPYQPRLRDRARPAPAQGLAPSDRAPHLKKLSGGSN